MFLGHPKGLVLLFTTAMWERFSFYTTRALVVLYMTTALIDGGLGWSRQEAISLYGFYMGIAYMTPVLGGYLSDCFLGQRQAALIGATLMAIGHFFLSFSSIPLFYAAFALIALGNGFFKPCVTSMLGQLYKEGEESRCNSAYSLFYMGTNIGAMIASLIAGWALISHGYHWGFAAAGFGMLVALVIFYWGKDRYLGNTGLKPSTSHQEGINLLRLTPHDRRRLGIVFFLFLVTLLFIIAWEQAGGVITLYIEGSVERTWMGWKIPTPILANLDPGLIILLAPLFSSLWQWLGKYSLDPSVALKMAFGCFAMALSFIVLSYMTTLNQPSWGWLILNKLLVVIAELSIIPISWAAVTRLTPKPYVSQVMGIMFASVGIGSYFAGFIGSFVDLVGEREIFQLCTLTMLLASVICILINPTMKRWEHKTAAALLNKKTSATAA